MQLFIDSEHHEEIMMPKKSWVQDMLVSEHCKGQSKASEIGCLTPKFKETDTFLVKARLNFRIKLR